MQNRKALLLKPHPNLCFDNWDESRPTKLKPFEVFIAHKNFAQPKGKILPLEFFIASLKSAIAMKSQIIRRFHR